MRRTLAVMLGCALLGLVGCQKDNNHMDDHSSKESPKMMKTDACSHCPGVQTATADGKCPACGMKVKS